MKELYKKYRPKTLDQVIGQDACVRSLQTMIKKKTIPHTILFSGPSGCGKTTLARILRKELKCSKTDFSEMNCADVRGIDEVRKIRRVMHLAPIGGDVRIWLVDEAHKLTNDAQNAFLKMLEDTPDHVYFMLATTDPNKLKNTIRTRSSEVKVKNLNAADMTSLLNDICKKEKKKTPNKVIVKIVEIAEGSARKALVLLHQVIDMDSTEDMLDTIEKTTHEVAVFALAKILMNPHVKWKPVAKILLDLKEQDTDAEGIRYMVMGYAQSALLKNWGSPDRAYNILESFRDHFYDSKFAGVTAACYEVVMGQ
ncbi:MAG TPA: AAA family ATPase [Candidatus Glassbacteria bacterium]|nr:AAA family ATPase [Candidatus Glassbacteria bacterium]